MSSREQHTRPPCQLCPPFRGVAHFESQMIQDLLRRQFCCFSNQILMTFRRRVALDCSWNRHTHTCTQRDKQIEWYRWQGFVAQGIGLQGVSTQFQLSCHGISWELHRKTMRVLQVEQARLKPQLRPASCKEIPRKPASGHREVPGENWQL